MRPGRPPEKETTLSELAGDSALVPKKEQLFGGMAKTKVSEEPKCST